MNYRPKITPKLAKEEVVAKKTNKHWLMRFIAWLHLWPSIVSGLILVFVCLTGTIIVYGDEIMDWSAGDAKYVENVGPQKITDKQLHQVIQAYNKNMSLSDLVFFKDPERSVRARAFDTVHRYLCHLYIDQYQGKVLKEDKTIFFFFVTAHIHASFLAGKIGGWVVAISTVIFLISSITGLVLWWPKRWTKKTREASFTIKWKAKFKRFNYDLHNVYGFYSLILCVILSATGLLIFFEPLGDGLVKVVGGSDKHVAQAMPKAVKDKSTVDMVQTAYSLFDHEGKDKESVSIWAMRQEKSGAYVYSLGNSGLKSSANLEVVAVDKYTGKRLPIQKADLIHDKTENMVWQLHMGQWWGQLGKLSTFLAGIIATSLPITGFLIWWGRRNKKPKKRSQVTLKTA